MSRKGVFVLQRREILVKNALMNAGGMAMSCMEEKVGGTSLGEERKNDWTQALEGLQARSLKK